MSRTLAFFLWACDGWNGARVCGSNLLRNSSKRTVHVSPPSPPPHLRVPLGDLLRHLLEVLLERVRQLQEQRGGEGGEDVERHQPDAHADGVQELERRRSKFKRRALEDNPEQLSLIKNWKFAFLCETYIRTRIIFASR